jgi:hypothetical protein
MDARRLAGRCVPPLLAGLIEAEAAAYELTRGGGRSEARRSSPSRRQYAGCGEPCPAWKAEPAVSSTTDGHAFRATEGREPTKHSPPGRRNQGPGRDTRCVRLRRQASAPLFCVPRRETGRRRLRPAVCFSPRKLRSAREPLLDLAVSSRLLDSAQNGDATGATVGGRVADYDLRQIRGIGL